MELQVKIESFDHQGRGIAHNDNKTIFVTDALPGEEVIVELINIKKKYMDARVKKYITTSSDRIKPECPYYDKCGGCDIMHIPYEKQLEFKNNKIKDIMRKFASVDESIIEDIIPCQNNTFYRNKITLQVREELGLFEKKSYKVVNIDKCLITNNKINELIEVLNTYDLSKINSIVVRCTKLNDIMCIFTLREDICDNVLINPIKDNVSSIFKVLDSKYINIYGDRYITDIIDEYKFKISPSAFFQVNSYQVFKLYNKVLEYLDLKGNENILDLYCGTGTIGIYLSKKCNKVLGIEVNKQSIEDSKINKEINNINNIDFICGKTCDVINDVSFKPDAIVVDPPRSGLDRGTVNYLLRSKCKRIIYVSCDPVTLARDIKLLAEYSLVKITPIDMFPNTNHVECVCVLNRR